MITKNKHVNRTGGRLLEIDWPKRGHYMNFYTRYSCKCKYNLNSKNNYPAVLFDFQSFLVIISFKSIFFSRVRQEQH